MERHLRFAPEILARLGEELVPHPELGIVELVRNAYDADATWCSVELAQTVEPRDTLVVKDDGQGMTSDAIANGFLLLGRSGKSDDSYTPSGRRKIGEKGLGRLAALRLGREVELRSRPAEQPGVEWILQIDWDRYANVETVEDVAFAITESRTDASPGTTITIRELRHRFRPDEIDRLSRTLLMLTGPFPDASDFRVALDAPEFAELAQRISGSYFEEYIYKLEASIDAAGSATARLLDWRGDVVARAGHDEVAVDRRQTNMALPRFETPPAQLEVWMFNRNITGFRAFHVHEAQSPQRQLRQWLDQVGGIHVFHRGLRVHPYGDPNNDWLDLNFARARNPEERASTNNSVGRVVVTDDEKLLVPKTDRSGFTENLAFRDLREFTQRAIDWSGTVRVTMREDRNRENLVESQKSAAKAASDFRRVINELPDTYAPTKKLALERMKEVEDYAKKAEDEARLYRSLSTVGTSTVVFAHETLGPAGQLNTWLDYIDHIVRERLTEEDYKSELADPISRMSKTAESLKAFSELPLRLVKKSKRKVTDVDVDRACHDIVDLFSAHFADHEITVDLQLSAPDVRLRATVSDIEAILTNLLMNSVHAFLDDDMPDRERIVRISTTVVGLELALRVDDSGPGIRRIPLHEIWTTGSTTRTDGTGFGLTIVSGTVAQLKGRKLALESGDLGGAHFEIRLPIHKNLGA